jgi:hypothetical protein
MTSFELDPKCKDYTQSISTLAIATARNDGDPKRCTKEYQFLTCQTQNFESAEGHLQQLVQDRADLAFSNMGCSGRTHVDWKLNRVGAENADSTPEQLAQSGMASNCYRVDTNDATHTATATCTPQYDMTDLSDGARVRNNSMTTRASLRLCDVSDAAMPQVQEDLRKLAAYNLAQQGFVVDNHKNLACQIMMLPTTGL